jgi:hypothetical protein
VLTLPLSCLQCVVQRMSLTNDQRQQPQQQQQQQQRHPSEEPSDLIPSPAGPTSSTKSKGGSSSPTLGDMLAAGVLQAGQDNVTVTYRGVSYSASLQANGTIAFKGTASKA